MFLGLIDLIFADWRVSLARLSSSDLLNLPYDGGPFRASLSKSFSNFLLDDL